MLKKFVSVSVQKNIYTFSNESVSKFIIFWERTKTMQRKFQIVSISIEDPTKETKKIPVEYFYRQLEL